jgi:Phytanoyl-CoA dioxygenase (PhyH)
MMRAALDRLFAAFRTRRDYAYHAKRCARHPMPAPSPRAATILEALRRDAYHVVEGYWDRDRCNQAIEELDRILHEYPQFVHGAPKSDLRIFGADRLSESFAAFGGDPVLAEVATLQNRMPTRLGVTLAARLPASERSLGSGEGWHRDQFFVATKAMLYLTDVGPDNGPFQMIRSSFALDDVCRDIARGRLGHMQYRIRDDQVEKLVAEDAARLKTFTAPAGTLIVFNASSIHRGKPIARGVRYALTNYYFTIDWSDAQIHSHFAPVAMAV